MKEPVGIYVHIPFCLSKCPYCDFYSEAGGYIPKEAYTGAVCRAISFAGEKRRKADSVYFGGGTPSLLGPENVARILETVEKFFILEGPEITIEANPAAASDGSLRGFRLAGVNRVSFGVQSADGTELLALGRLHTPEDARRSILAAHKAGFDNISADLMLGIPRQTVRSMKKSIDFLTALPVSHISAYMLKIEEDTPFAGSVERTRCPGEDALAEIYPCCVETLESKDFMRYEVSNFAKKGRESRHNLKYWRCVEYLGVGPSAHSFLDGRRFYMPKDLDAFINAENPMSLAVPDGEGGGFEEYAMLRLRLCEGLDLTEASESFHIDTSHIAKKAEALEKHGLLSFKNNVISFKSKGFLVSNAVTAELLL